MDAYLIGGIVGGVLCCVCVLLALLIVCLLRQRTNDSSAADDSDSTDSIPVPALANGSANEYTSTAAFQAQHDGPPNLYGIYDSPPTLDNQNYTTDYASVVKQTIYA